MGRQPTSGYCQTCRKRRIKCDKARPHCGRCLASGYPCGGYDLPLRVQILGVHAEQDGTQRLVKVQSSSGSRLAHVLPSSENDMRLGLRDSQHWQQQTSAAYFFATYNWAPFWRPLILSATNGDSLEINRVCFRAISHGYMGLSLGDRALQAQGNRLYGQVLREVQSLLLQQEKPRLAELGFTMVLMDMYEFAMNKVMGPEPPHHVGIIEILQHCGPETFQEETLLNVFRSCRALLVCQALCRQSRCVVEDEPWKTLPWQKLPKTFEDRLMDIIVDLPGIAESVVNPHKRAACLDKISVLSVALQEWRWDWHAAHAASVRQIRHAGGSLVEGMPNTNRPPPSIVSQMLLTSLEFDSPRLALDILYYNAALLYLMQLEAAARGQTSPPEPEILSREDEAYIRRQAARNSDGGNPLLLPGKVRFRCQAAAEAFMTLSCITRLLATTPEKETVVPPAAIGVVYCVLRDQLRLGDGWLALLLSKHALFHDAERVFEGFFVSVER